MPGRPQRRYVERWSRCRAAAGPTEVALGPPAAIFFDRFRLSSASFVVLDVQCPAAWGLAFKRRVRLGCVLSWTLSDRMIRYIR